MSRTPATDAITEIRRELDQAERRRTRALKASASVALGVLVLVAGVAMVGAARPQPKESGASSTMAAPVMTLRRDPGPVIVTATKSSPPSLRPEPAPKSPSKPTASPVVQKKSIRLGAYGYEPPVVEVRAGVPVALTIGRGEGCAAGFLIPSLGVSADNSTRQITVELPAMQPGAYRFSCAMEMITGTLVVV